MVGSRFVGLALVEKSMIHLLGCHHFCLAFLLLENGVREFMPLVEYGNLAQRILTDRHLSIVQAIGGTIDLDLVDHIFELEGEVL